MAFTPAVQKVQNSASAAATVNVPVAQATTAGNAIVVMLASLSVAGTGPVALDVVTDNVGNVYTLRESVSGNNNAMKLFDCLNPQAGITSWTGTTLGAALATHLAIAVMEFPFKNAVFDTGTHASASGTSNTANSGNTGVPTAQATELAVGAIGLASATVGGAGIGPSSPTSGGALTSVATGFSFSIGCADLTTSAVQHTQGALSATDTPTWLATILTYYQQSGQSNQTSSAALLL